MERTQSHTGTAGAQPLFVVCYYSTYPAAATGTKGAGTPSVASSRRTFARSCSKTAKAKKSTPSNRTDAHRYKTCASTGKRKVNCICTNCLSTGGGKNICVHGRQRHKCKECCGASICEHGDQRSRCKKCKQSGKGGNGLCPHEKEIWRGTCSKCKNNKW